jgi:hypothetical protein
MKCGGDNGRFRSKADTLRWLEHRRRYSRVLPCYTFTTKSWDQNRDKITHELINFFGGDRVIVRSSAAVEDQRYHSAAGAFLSVPGIDPLQKNRLSEAITTVASHYPADPENQILIQPYLEYCAFAGVASSHMAADGRPYYVFSEEHGGKTDGITAGTDSGSATFLRRDANSPAALLPPHLVPVLWAIQELEHLFSNIPIQIEYACLGKADIVLFQVRPLVTKVLPSPATSTRGLRQEIERALAADPALPGCHTILGLMPDWNPAELLGEHPRPLALSIYRHLISKGTWCRARSNLGYEKMGDSDFLHVLAGRPYVNARTSFRSFLPPGLHPETKVRLIEAWVTRLKQHPALHDSIEFEIVPTCTDFEFAATFQERYPKVLNDYEFNNYRTQLATITSSLLKFPLCDELSLQKHNCRFRAKANSPTLAHLVVRAANFGSLPFARIARLGFVAESFLRSALRCGAFAPHREQDFRLSIRSVSSFMAEDWERLHNGQLAPDAFMERYGHLRPSSFDIRSPCYQNRYWSDITNHPFPHHEPSSRFYLTERERASLGKLLKEETFGDVQPDTLVDWMRSAIAGREWSKFHFSILLSELLECITAWGGRHGFDTEALSMLELDDILAANDTSDDTFTQLEERINTAKERRLQEKGVFLGPIIYGPEEADCFRIGAALPHFIGNGIIRAPTRLLEGHTIPETALKGYIICIRQADPGFDWLFGEGITGLVTAYGGPNSHMAVRCAELGMPAAIGCGPLLFDKLSRCEALLLDCRGRKVLGTRP